MADDGPRGFILRGKALPPEGQSYSCPMCPTRACQCFSSAWAASKRISSSTASLVTIETADGVLLARTGSAASGGHVRTPTRGSVARGPGGTVENTEPSTEPEELSLDELVEQEEAEAES